MSTFAPDPVVLAALLAALFGTARLQLRTQPAMRTAPIRRATRRTPGADAPALLASYAVATDIDALARPTSGASRVRRVVHEALGLLPPSPAEYGEAARISPLRRIRSAALLVVLLVTLGIVVALSVGLVAFLGGFLLEQAIK